MTNLAPGDLVRVRLVKRKSPDVEYEAVVLLDDDVHVVVRGVWSEEDARDIGPVWFEPGDVFTEHYWRDRWYSIKEVRSRDGTLKGWYCDVARPVRIEKGELTSADLILDLWVSADGLTVQRLDEDEFAASDSHEAEPITARHALDALCELEQAARQGFVGIEVEPQ